MSSTLRESVSRKASVYLGRAGPVVAWALEASGWALAALGILAIGVGLLGGAPSLVMVGGGAALLLLGGAELLLLRRGMREP